MKHTQTQTIERVTYETIALLDSQPLLTDEVRLVLRLKILQEHIFEKPRGIRTRARVVMPDVQVIETTEWSLRRDEKRIDAVSLQDGP
jgi:hypothetical protein